MHARDYQPGEAVPGTVYRVVRLIGAGGMGTVYDVEDTTIGKRYVLKTLHPRLGAREDLARRMQNEARTLARLHHPNIVEVITAGLTADDLRLPFYVMERLSGQSLRLVLEKKGQLELTHAYHIGIDLLDALDHAHDKGVVHRDVKPDNIFLHRTAAGITVTKLLDFGIVSLLDAPGAETAGRFLGTLRYAAPEQLRGDKPTPKTDVYAAALVVYEMLAGHGPFDDEGDPHQVGAAHMRKAAPPLSMFVPVPAELDALVGAALAKDPDSRPRDAFSFAASLRNLKRKLNATLRSPEASHHGTESRATAPAVLGPPAGAPNLDVRQGSPSGPYVISPGVAPSSAQLGNTSATVTGMVSPPLGQSVATALGASSTGTTPEAVDRVGPTQTQALESTRAPSSETQRTGQSWLTAGPTRRFDVGSNPELRSTGAREQAMSNVRAVGDSPSAAPIEWPAERLPLPSEAPQVRSLHANAFARPGWGTVVASTVGIGGFLAMTLFVFASRAGSGVARVMVLPGAAMAPALGGPPGAPPVVLAPAPTIAPPALEDPGSHGLPGMRDHVTMAALAPASDAPGSVASGASSDPSPSAARAHPGTPRRAIAIVPKTPTPTSNATTSMPAHAVAVESASSAAPNASVTSPRRSSSGDASGATSGGASVDRPGPGF